MISGSDTVTSPRASCCASSRRSTPARISSIAASHRSRKCAPGALSDTLRVVRCRSSTPSRSSSLRTDLLTAAGVSPSSFAAALKLSRLATTVNGTMSSKTSRSIMIMS